MIPRARAALVAVAFAAASYVVVTHQVSHAALIASPHGGASATYDGTELPARAVGDVVVDDLHRKVFVSMPTVDSIVVTDLDGQVVHTVTALSGPGEMTLSPNGASLYVAERGSSSIARIDTETYALTRFQAPDSTCPVSIAFTGTRVWFTYQSGGCSTGGATTLGFVEPSTGAFTLGLATVAPASLLRALPDRPDRAVTLSPKGQLSVYDVTSGLPIVVAQATLTGADCLDAAVVSGGDQVVTTCYWSRDVRIFHTADLSPGPSIPVGVWSNAVAASADGHHLAFGKTGSGCDLYVRDISGGTPGTFVSSYDFESDHYASYYSLDYSTTGRLVAAREHANDNAVLYVFKESAKCPTEPTLEMNRTAVAYQGTVTGRGSLGHPPGDGATVSVTRRDRSGTHDLGTIALDNDGIFHLRDTPRTTGPVVYSVSYPGDDMHGPGGVKAMAFVHPLGYDVTGDGRSETIVGVPGEDLGATADAGQFHVLEGGSSGPITNGSVSISQSTAGVPGSAEPGDRFGHAEASGDFDGDGHADVAVSAPAEDLGSVADAGGVWIFYGSTGGLRTDNVRTLTADNTFLRGTSGARFGHALAAGDFNADGRDDLAIGAPGAEQVFVAPGTADGVTPDLISSFNEDTPDVPGVKHSGDQFGWSLAASNIDGNLYADLAVGAPSDRDDHGYPTGSVTILAGNYGGLVSVPWRQQRWTDSPGVPGASATFTDDSPDRFGHDVAFADMTGDGFDDLAVGAPGAPAADTDGTRKADAGTVTILYSNNGTLDTTYGIGAYEVTQTSYGMPGFPGRTDRFGTTLAAGDTNGDRKAELAIYSPGDTYVTVVPGASGGLAFGSAKGWTQNSSGIPGSSEPGDHWGHSLRFVDIKGTGRASLIVGADGENSGQGAFTAIHSTSTGLTGTGAQYVSQNTTGVPGTPENGDGFGTF